MKIQAGGLKTNNDSASLWCGGSSGVVWCVLNSFKRRLDKLIVLHQ